jgi:anaerobic magnesium-protoporphyrin IX monomethyl ester cyclase
MRHRPEKQISGAPRGRELHYVLVNPPLTDPTAPYHSLSYIVSTAKKVGFHNCTIIDANIEALNFVFSRSFAAKLLRRIASWSPDGSSSNWSALRMKLSKIASRYCATDPEQAVSQLRSEESFYIIEKYNQSISVILDWLDVVTFEGLPFSFNGFFVEHAGFANFSSVLDLSDESYLHLLNQPFQEYYDDHLMNKVRLCDPGLVGISISYTRQLPFAAWLCKLLRKVVPNAVICCGGTEVTDLVKLTRETYSAFQILDCDVIVAGEADSTFPEILEMVAAGRVNFQSMPGVLTPKCKAAIPRSQLSRTEDITKHPSPVYDIWNWDAYWSPEPFVLYSPTRGCYWNKCTFCDYGLNDNLPTSPSRERPIALVNEDLNAIQRISNNVYLAVDAISPSFLRKFSLAVCDRQRPVFWSAECRIEKSIATKDLAALLKAAGCIMISFGLESGNQRVLGLIDKGIDIANVPSLLKALADNHIGVQLMTFYGFPTERHDEALDTLMFLESSSDSWQLVGFGRFELTSGAIVARESSRFEIEVLPGDDDITRTMSWRHTTQATNDEFSYGRDYSCFDWITQTKFWLRPFLGGIDTAHTFLYCKRFGTDFGKLATRINKVREHSPLSAELLDLHVFHVNLDRSRKGCAHWSDARQWLYSPAADPFCANAKVGLDANMIPI